MSILRSVIQGSTTVLQSTPRTADLGHPSNPVGSWLSVPPAHAGVDVDDTNALTCSAVYAGLALLSGASAQLPLKVMRRRKGGGAEVARDHELHETLAIEPNPEQTSIVSRAQFMSRKILFGDGFYAKQRRQGDAVRLWPLHPDRVTQKRRKNFDLYYEVRSSDGSTVREYRPEQIVHVPNLPVHGSRGVGLVTLARQAISTSLAAEKHGALFFKNYARPLGILKTKNTFRDREKAEENIRSMFERTHGDENKHRIAVFDWGLEWQALGMTSEEAQFFELRGFQVVEVARFLGIPPHMLQHLDKATFNNIEELGAAFVRYSLQRHLIEIEQELTRKLIPRNQWDLYFIKHNVDALVRGNLEARGKFYEVAARTFMKVDEIRGKEDLPPLPDGKGDVILSELNRAPLEGRPREQYSKLLVSQISRAAARETKALQSLVAKHLGAGAEVLEHEAERFFRGQLEFIVDALEDALELGASLELPVPTARRVAESWLAYSRREFLSALHSAAAAAELEQLLESAAWLGRPAEFVSEHLLPTSTEEQTNAAA